MSGQAGTGPLRITLVGGPRDGDVLLVPEGTTEWREFQLEESSAELYQKAADEPLASPKTTEHLWRRDPQWREFEGYEPIPFVYALPLSEEREGA